MSRTNIEIDDNLLEVVDETVRDPRQDRSGRRCIQHLLAAFSWIPADAQTDFEAAARVYSLCRRPGVTPRGLIDRMIVAIALRLDSSVLAVDGDFDRIASVVPIRLFSS